MIRSLRSHHNNRIFTITFHDNKVYSDDEIDQELPEDFVLKQVLDYRVLVCPESFDYISTYTIECVDLNTPSHIEDSFSLQET